MKCRRIFMKKFGIMIIALAFLVVGMAMAEPGIPKVNEVQGLRTTTTVIAAGNFNSESNVNLLISTGQPLAGPATFPPLTNGLVYQTVYSEDTQNSEVGYVSYDKDLDVSTGNKVSGEQNVKAVKQITYLGVDASSIITTDYMMLDGAGEAYGPLNSRIICPFAGDAQAPTFCNKVETGSTMNLKIANLNTQMGERFIMRAADPGIEIYNNVGVGSYAADVPSKGSVTAYIKGSIREGGRDTATMPALPQEAATDLYETMTFSDSTSVSGDISTFAKGMSYSSILG
jgi:hypothetical protein